jgi:hypothetical protein
MIQVAVTNGDFIGTRPKLGATGNGDDFRRDSLEMRKATSQSMLAKVAGAGIRFYEVIGTYLKRRGKMRASCHRGIGSSCRIGTSHSHCQHSDREDRTEDSICFKPPIELALFFRRHPLIRDLILHDSLPFQPRRITNDGTDNSFDDEREAAGQGHCPGRAGRRPICCAAADQSSEKTNVMSLIFCTGRPL